MGWPDATERSWGLAVNEIVVSISDSNDKFQPDPGGELNASRRSSLVPFPKGSRVDRELARETAAFGEIQLSDREQSASRSPHGSGDRVIPKALIVAWVSRFDPSDILPTLTLQVQRGLLSSRSEISCFIGPS